MVLTTGVEPAWVFPTAFLALRVLPVPPRQQKVQGRDFEPLCPSRQPPAVPLRKSVLPAGLEPASPGCCRCSSRLSYRSEITKIYLRHNVLCEMRDRDLYSCFYRSAKAYRSCRKSILNCRVSNFLNARRYDP